MSYLKKYWKKYKFLFILSVVCVSLEALCDLMQPRIMVRLINDGAIKGDLDYVIGAGLTMLGVAGLGAVFALTRNIVASYVSQGFGMDLRHDLFSKIQYLSVEDMDGFEGGSLVTRMTNDITQVQNFINGMMRIFFKAPIMCIGAIIMVIMLNPRAMPVIVPVVAAVALIISISMRMTYHRFAMVQQSLDKLNITMREYLTGIRLVKAFRRFREEERRFSESNDLLTENTVRANRVLAVFSPCMAVFVNLGIAMIIFLGARWVDTGDMDVGEIMAFVTYMTQILVSLGMISNVLNMFVRVKTSNERIGEVMNIQSQPQSQPQSQSQPQPDGQGGVPEESVTGSGAVKGGFPHIEFDGVDFEYRGSTGQAALSGLNFSVAKGQTLGVIGPTGSGKSTLAALLMRFYSASRGEIRIEGNPIAVINESTLRKKTVIVPQTATLFTGTIKENILWGRENASDAQIEAAALTAAAHDFITAAPEGYNTLIGQHGVNLSGGQKQRVSIARALIREPEILILDDCTSAIDVVTEAKVKRALRQFSEDMTCILITQRVNSAMTCDKILVLDNGKQAGTGSHEELMENCAVYRDIYRSQIGKAEI